MGVIDYFGQLLRPWRLLGVGGSSGCPAGVLLNENGFPVLNENNEYICWDGYSLAVATQQGETYSMADAFTDGGHGTGSHWHNTTLAGQSPPALDTVGEYAEVGGFFGDEEVRGVSEFDISGLPTAATQVLLKFTVTDLTTAEGGIHFNAIGGLYGQDPLTAPFQVLLFEANGTEELADFQQATFANAGTVDPTTLTAGQEVSLDITAHYNARKALGDDWLGVRLQLQTSDPNAGAIVFQDFELEVTHASAPGTAPAIDGVPTISGSTSLGAVLTATAATTTGSPTPTRFWQWRRNGVDIAGATNATYTLVLADLGTDITVRQLETNSSGVASAISDPELIPAAAAPVISGIPSISGTTGVGDVLTATAASVTGNPTPTRTWQWYRDAAPIGGATNATYTIVLADQETDITVVQTETNVIDSDSATSSAVSIPSGSVAPVITGVPTISGDTTVGSVLTATPASVTGTPTPTRTWQWKRDNVNISGATSITYTLVEADQNATITVTQTETNIAGVDTATSTGVDIPIDGMAAYLFEEEIEPLILRDEITSLTAAPRVGGTCLSFDGSNDFLTLDTPLSFAGEFTLAIWAKRDNTNNWHVLISNSASNAFFGFDNTSVNFGFRLLGAGSFVSPQHNVDTTKWNHFAITRDVNNKVDFFVNGSFVLRLFSDVAVPGSAGWNQFGTFWSNQSLPHDGLLAHAYADDSALTPAQIATLYNVTKRAGSAKSAIIAALGTPSLYLPLDHLDGNVTYDCSGNGNNATQSGGVSIHTGNDVPFSLPNEVGYTDDGGVRIPPKLPDFSTDAKAGAALQFPGPLARNVAMVNSPCLVLDGVNDEIIIAGLTGSETVTSSGGTATPTVVAGKITFTAGTCWDLQLSNGSVYPLAGTFHDVSGNGNHGTPSGGPTWGTQDVFHYLPRFGFRDDGGTKIPALLDKSAAADGSPITNPAGSWLNGADTQYNFAPEPNAPWTRGRTIPTAYTEGDTLPAGMTKQTNGSGFEHRFVIEDLP